MGGIKIKFENKLYTTNYYIILITKILNIFFEYTLTNLINQGILLNMLGQKFYKTSLVNFAVFSCKCFFFLI